MTKQIARPTAAIVTIATTDNNDSSTAGECETVQEIISTYVYNILSNSYYCLPEMVNKDIVIISYVVLFLEAVVHNN